MAYAWHPWAGQLVRVHEVIERATGAWARCSPVGADIVRQQEIPTWMLDASVCRAMWRAPEPIAALSALVALRALLSGAMENAAAALPGAAIASATPYRGGRHAPPPSPGSDAGASTRSLLGAQPLAAEATPGWSALPDQARHAVTALMTRLLITHASGTVPEPGSSADER